MHFLRHFCLQQPVLPKPVCNETAVLGMYLFMADLALEFIYSKRKTRYIITYFLLFIACIPYGTILPKLGITLPRDIGYFVSFMPLIRSCYALAIVVSWFAVQTSSKMFLTYVIILFSGLYLGSLGFMFAKLT